MCGDPLVALSGFQHRHMDGQNRTRAVRPVSRLDPATLRLNEPAANRQTEPGSGATPILRLDTVELVEDPLEIAGRNARPAVDNLDRRGCTIAPGAKFDITAGRRVF